MLNVINMENTIKEIDKSYAIHGKDALGIQSGTILKVLIAKEWRGEEGKYIMKVEDKQRPFVKLNNGLFWGADIENCSFEVIRGPIQIN
jgi:hypothetical protein